MKKLLAIFLLPVFLGSCNDEPERTPYTPKFIEAEQILDNYSITTLESITSAEAWIGTKDNGLIRYSDSGVEIFNSSNSPISESSPIYDIAIDYSGNVWIGANGLIKFDGATFTRYSTENSSIPVNLVKSIAVDQDNNIWFSSANDQTGGLVKFDRTNFTVYTPENSDLPVHYVRGVIADGNNNVWVSSYETLNQSFISRISGSEWHTFGNADFGFTAAGVGQLAINGSDEIFAIVDYSMNPSLGTHGSKLFSFLPETTVRNQFNFTNLITSITVDTNGKVWYVSRRQFGVYNGEAWIIESPTFTKADLTSITEGPEEKMWIGTTDGVYIMEKTQVIE
jgi:ligand-binding sensor domain-containing protein